MYGRDFAADFIPKITKLTLETLDSLPDSEICDLQQGILRPIAVSMERFLCRIQSPDKVAEISETLQLKMAIRFLKSPSLELRVEAVVIINLFATFRPSTRHRFITAEYLKKWINENKVLELLFDIDLLRKTTSTQIEEIFTFMIDESQYEQTIEYLKIIWTAFERVSMHNDPLPLELHILLHNLGYWLDRRYVDFLFSKFDELDTSMMSMHHFKLMASLSPPKQKNQDPPKKILDLLWNLSTMSDESGANHNHESIVSLHFLIFLFW